MSKICLKLLWANHVLVSKPNGKKVLRDEYHSEICEVEDLLSKVLARVRRKGQDTDSEYKRFWDAVKKVQRDNCKATVTVVEKTTTGKARKMFTYTIAPIKIQFDNAGCTYVIKDDGQVLKVAGVSPIVINPDNVYSGLTDEQAKEKGIVRSQMSKADSDAYIADKIAARLEEGKEDAPPFSTVPQSGMQKTKGKAKQKAKPKDSAKPVADKPKGDEKPRVAVDKPARKLNKKQQQECEKFNLNLDKLPDMKPKGMNKRIWNAVCQAVIL